MGAIGGKGGRSLDLDLRVVFTVHIHCGDRGWSERSAVLLGSEGARSLVGCHRTLSPKPHMRARIGCWTTSSVYSLSSSASESPMSSATHFPLCRDPQESELVGGPLVLLPAVGSVVLWIISRSPAPGVLATVGNVESGGPELAGQRLEGRECARGLGGRKSGRPKTVGPLRLPRDPD